MKIDDLKLGEPLFAILPVPGTKNIFAIVYPDKTYALMEKEEVRAEFSNILELNDGPMDSIEELKSEINEARTAEDEDEGDEVDNDDEDDDEPLVQRKNFFEADYRDPDGGKRRRLGSFDISSTE